jgi:hypothetical protein
MKSESPHVDTRLPKDSLGHVKELVDKFGARLRAQCKVRNGKRLNDASVTVKITWGLSIYTLYSFYERQLCTTYYRYGGANSARTYDGCGSGYCILYFYPLIFSNNTAYWNTGCLYEVLRPQIQRRITVGTLFPTLVCFGRLPNISPQSCPSSIVLIFNFSPSIVNFSDPSLLR